MIAETVRGETVDTDRVLLAAQLHNDDQHAAAYAVLATVTAATPAVLAAFAQARDLLAEHEQLTQRLQLCSDDPRHYVDLFEDARPAGSLLDWADWRCTELEADAAQVLADARVHADTIVAQLDRSVAA